MTLVIKLKKLTGVGRKVLISFPGYAQPAGDKSIPDINHSTLAKHITDFGRK